MQLEDRNLALAIETLEQRLNLAAAFTFDASEALVLATGENSTTTFRLRGIGKGTVNLHSDSTSFSVIFHSTSERSTLQIITRVI